MHKVIQKSSKQKLRAYLPMLPESCLSFFVGWIHIYGDKDCRHLVHSSQCWLGVNSITLSTTCSPSHSTTQTGIQKCKYSSAYFGDSIVMDVAWEKTLFVSMTERCKLTSETQRKKDRDSGPVILPCLKTMKDTEWRKKSLSICSCFDQVLRYAVYPLWLHAYS